MELRMAFFTMFYLTRFRLCLSVTHLATENSPTSRLARASKLSGELSARWQCMLLPISAQFKQYFTPFQSNLSESGFKNGRLRKIALPSEIFVGLAKLIFKMADWWKWRYSQIIFVSLLYRLLCRYKKCKKKEIINTIRIQLKQLINSPNVFCRCCHMCPVCAQQFFKMPKLFSFFFHQENIVFKFLIYLLFKFHFHKCRRLWSHCKNFT